MEKGIKVVITKPYAGHCFNEGTIAVSLGEQHEAPYQDWHNFECTSTGDTQWLLPEHYKLLVDDSTGEVSGKSDKLCKTKIVYVVYEGDEFVYATPDREDARGMKADLGGKREGIIILAYTQAKEIR